MVIDPGSIAIGALTCLLVEKAYNKIFGEGSSSQDVYSGSAGVAVSKGFMAKNHVNITEIKQEVKQVSTSNSSSFYSLKNWGIGDYVFAGAVVSVGGTIVYKAYKIKKKMDERAERLEKRIKELEKIDSSDSETDDGDEQISNLAVSGQQQAHIEVSKY